MKTIPSLLSFIAACALAGAAPAQTPVRVTADNVNLRAKPALAAEVVAQAAYDERLVAYEIGAEWVEIAAPPAVDLWVMKQYVQTPQNTIGANRVNLRAGPSINYNVVATLALGDRVEPRGEEMQEWLKIAPPPSARVWISRAYVEILSGDAAAVAPPASQAENAETAAALGKKPAEPASSEPTKAEKGSKKRKSKAKTESAGVSSPDATPSAEALPTPIVSPSVPEGPASAREIPVPAPANLKLIPLPGQGQLSEFEGELRAAPLINEAPTRYRVVRWTDNRWQILCHVYGEAAKFRSRQDKRVAVKGRVYWIQGAAAPVLVPDQVRELSAAE